MTHTLRIMVPNINVAQAIHPPATTAGHVEVEWEELTGEQVKAAEEAFNRAMNAGYAAFSVDTKTEEAEQIDTFDPEAKDVLMVAPVAGG